MKAYHFQLKGQWDDSHADLFDPDVEGYAVTVSGRRAPEGTWEAAGLTVDARDDGPPVSASTFREIGVGTLLNAALRDLHQREAHSRDLGAPPDLPSVVGVTDAEEWQAIGQQIAAGRADFTTDDRGELSLDGWTLPVLRGSKKADWSIPEEATSALRKLGPSSPHAAWTVATAAQFCASKNVPVTSGISKIFSIPYSTASHWLKLARQAGWAPASGRRSPRGR